MSGFLPGTRILIQTNRHELPIGGTVISTRKAHVSINFWNSKEVLMVTAILDDGRKLEQQASYFYLEAHYDPRIPF